MAHVVLVHGAWQGAWCWDRVAPALADAGHVVVTPTLRGSGARAGELDPEVGLAQHVDDVTSVVEATDTPVVLVVHSYAGMLPAQVVARCGSGAVGAVVFVDSFHPDQGESAIDQMPAPFPDVFRQRAAEEGDGWRLPATDALLDVWGLHDPADRRWVRERLTDWSLRCFESPSTAPAAVLDGLPRWYVAGTTECPSRAAFGPISERAAAHGCTVVGAPSGHDVMIEAPDVLVDVVQRAAAST